MVPSRRDTGVAQYLRHFRPFVDALLDRLVLAITRSELNVVCRALDRVLRVGQYYVQMWFSDKARFAYWDVFSRPIKSVKRFANTVTKVIFQSRISP
jgi:ABC-type oligopeptide transport system substrate-binding subunit